MNILKLKCEDIINISNQYTKNLKKLLSDEDKLILENYNGDTLPERVYNLLNTAEVCFCGNTPRFFSVVKGYATFCSKSCQSKHREANWSDEMKKHRSETISKSVKAIWNNEDNAKWLNDRNKKVGLAAKKMWDTASIQWKEDRNLKCSISTSRYAQNNPDELKERAKKAKTTRLSKTDSENKIIYNKYISTRVKNGTAIPQHLKSDFKIYTELVWRYTRKTYKLHYKDINPNNIKRSYNGFHLDHKLSIFEGFNNNIIPSIISSKFNLELIPAQHNFKKQRHSSISIKELLSII